MIATLVRVVAAVLIGVVVWALHLTDWVVFASAVLAWTFVARYARVQWNATAEGRHLMGYTIITAIFMTLASTVRLVRMFTPEVRPAASTAPALDIAVTVLYVMLMLLLLQRNQLFYKRQHEERHK